jgi:acetoin utilization deacetylase AcuC-like enzyme
MDTWYSEHHRGHHGHSEISRGELVAGFESPIRAEHVREAVLSARLGAVRTPVDAGLAAIQAVHDPAYVAFLSGAWNAWRALGRTHPALPMIWHAGLGLPRVVPQHIDGQLGFYSFDGGSAIVEGTWRAAYWSAQCAIAGAAALQDGAPGAFALCRPPGHHAAAALMGGYCYLNNAAIAAQALLGGRFPRVGVLDIDYHHGNGTQAIFWHRDDVFFASVHADPSDDYPYLSGHADEVGEGAGRGHTLNLPLPAGTEAPAYLAALEQAINAVLDKRCGAVVISLGVDTFEKDPISKFKLTSADYLEIGRRLRRLAAPTLFVF